MVTRVLILGGAGFVGSNLARFFDGRGYGVTVVDGFFPQTGSRRENLAGLSNRTTVIASAIESLSNLPALLNDTSLVIDCMAWTMHRLALRDPLFDCVCNVQSHLHLLAQIPEGCPATVVYLGSRGQYGKPNTPVIDEETPMIPEDVQGVHKTAADHHFRVFAKLKRLNVISVRFPNCYGPNQPRSGEDIGLIGGFIHDALQGKTVIVYGNHSRRSLLFVEDLCEVVERLSHAGLKGFAAFNVAGHDMAVRELAERVVEIAGRGTVRCEEPPQEIKALDLGQSTFSDEALRRVIGPIPRADFSRSLGRTIEYFLEQHDLAL